MPTRARGAQRAPERLLSPEEEIAIRYRQRLLNARQVIFRVRQGGSEISAAVGTRLDTIQNAAEELSNRFENPNVANNLANQPTAEITANRNDWIAFLKTDEGHALLSVRADYLKAQCDFFAKLARENKVRPLLKMLAKACKEFVLVAPSTTSTNWNLSREIFQTGGPRFRTVVKYYERASDRADITWGRDISSPTGLLLSISRTGTSLVQAALTLREFTRILRETSPTERNELVAANALFHEHVITDEEKRNILFVYAHFGTVVGLERNVNAEYEALLNPSAPSLSHRQRARYFPSRSLM